MEDYQLRVVQEKSELDIKIKDLENFTESESFTTKVSNYQQDLLMQQLLFMKNYSMVLHHRIEDFEENNETKEVD